MTESLLRFCDRVSAIVGAFLFAQFPQFFMQYLHELTGHVAELQHQIQLYENVARLSQKTPLEMISKFLSNSDPDVIRQGDLIKQIFDRYYSFSHAQETLANASLFTKPFLFLRYYNWQIGQDTLQNYQIGLTLTPEGIVYLIIGFFAGYGLFQLFLKGLYAIRQEAQQKSKS